jgi:hypothetical protein
MLTPAARVSTSCITTQDVPARFAAGERGPLAAAAQRADERSAPARRKVGGLCVEVDDCIVGKQAAQQFEVHAVHCHCVAGVQLLDGEPVREGDVLRDAEEIRIRHCVCLSQSRSRPLCTYCAVKPPSITNSVPVVNEDSSEAR